MVGQITLAPPLMHLAYFDESGDDGYPKYSSAIFVLSAIYLDHLGWRAALDEIVAYRRSLRAGVGLPVKLEFHTKDFMLNKNPYRTLGISDQDRTSVLDGFCDLLVRLDVRIVNVAIIKPRIRSGSYDVLDWALKMSVQRIENDLDPTRNSPARFMLITDEGRVGKMRSTTRRIQRFNFVPSKVGGPSIRRDIRTLIEDPLPKPSKESYFVQLADTVAFIVYLYVLHESGAANVHGRLPEVVDRKKVEDWMGRLLPSLNTSASGADRFGVVMHPAK